MQNKGLLTTFTVLFAIAALYSLSLTFVANSVESDAKEYSNGNSDLEFAYLDSMSSEEVYPVIGYTYGELRTKMLNLGLDLKGGMNVTLEVQIDEVVKALASFSKDNAFNQAIIDAKKEQQVTQADFVTLFGQEYQKKNPNGKLSSVFYTLDNKEKLSPNATNEEVLAFIKEEADDAIDRSFNVLRTRIGLFGAAQPNIQKLTGSDRILVELPGVKNKERVRQLLQGTAKLEFWLTYENQEIYPMLAQADELLGAANKLTSKTDSTVTDSTLAANTDTTSAVVADTTKEETASLLDKIESGAK
ncbi:MAG: protein translocase subunit SecDF, partial [Flavobacteriales bacterium]|nr:protein translocase subunit SecDF [Flavobacteriales bacterium]